MSKTCLAEEEHPRDAVQVQPAHLLDTGDWSWNDEGSGHIPAMRYALLISTAIEITIRNKQSAEMVAGYDTQRGRSVVAWSCLGSRSRSAKPADTKYTGQPQPSSSGHGLPATSAWSTPPRRRNDTPADVRRVAAGRGLVAGPMGGLAGVVVDPGSPDHPRGRRTTDTRGDRAGVGAQAGRW